MEWKPRVINPDELNAAIDLTSAVFGEGFVASETYRKEVTLVAEVDRTFVVDDGHTIAGTGSAYSYGMALPGATLPISGITEVGVLPTHRRRGVLTAIMNALLDQAVEREEPLAGLTASEGAIYRRYGFGVAARWHEVLVDTVASAELVTAEEPGRLRLVNEKEAETIIPAVWDLYWRRAAGEVSRNQVWFEMQALDSEDSRGDASSRYIVVHEDADGRPDGFATYRLKEGGAPDGYYFQLVVVDLAAASDQVEALLLRYLLDVDLVRQLRWGRAPVDLSLRWRLADPRAVKVVQERDHLWVRLLDIPKCLTARSYVTEGGGIIEVVDQRRPDVGGRFALDAAPDGAHCARVSLDPDVTLGVAELGALSLGGVTWSTLHRAGVVTEHTPGAVDRLDTIFRTTRAPHCSTGF